MNGKRRSRCLSVRGSQVSHHELLQVSRKTFGKVYATIDDKSSATVDREFRKLIKQIETETELKIKDLRTDGGGEYECDLTDELSKFAIDCSGGFVVDCSDPGSM